MEPDLAEIAALSREVAQDSRDWVILSEGNLSSRATADSMYVKASGRRMADATPEDFLHVPFAPLLALLDDPSAGDAEVAATFQAWGAGGLKPSVEALMHVICQTLGGAPVVMHTHPVVVNALLCSDQAEALVHGSIFPDQVVVLGPHQLLIPYVDPGLALARVVRRELAAHIDRFGEAPKTIYLRNHGMFALGASVSEALNITAMACKAAKVIGGALAVGSVAYLQPNEVQRLHVREDEIERRAALLHSGQPVATEPRS